MTSLRPFAYLPLIACLLLPVSFAPPAHAQRAPEDPVALVRAASWNELHATDHNHPFRFRLRKQADDGSSTTKVIVETNQGDVARLIAINDRPLSSEHAAAERSRLDNLIAHPEQQARRYKQEQADNDRANEMVRLLPDAFLYTYRGIVNTPDGPAWRLTFEPNSKFVPPNREAQVYHGMAGELWINCRDTRIARLDAHLIEDVNFGWGVIGRLYKGGTIQVIERRVVDNRWETTHLALNLTGKLLMFHSVTYKSIEDSSDFTPVAPRMSYQDAIRLLESLPG